MAIPRDGLWASRSAKTVRLPARIMNAGRNSRSMRPGMKSVFDRFFNFINTKWLGKTDIGARGPEFVERLGRTADSDNEKIRQFGSDELAKSLPVHLGHFGIRL